MKICNDTLGILKSLSTINQSLVLNEQGVLVTANESRTILARAEISEKFPHEFGIYDLNNFLNVIDLFKAGQPDYVFDEKFVTISLDKRSVRYTFADVGMIQKKKLPIDGIKIDDDVARLTFAGLDAGHLNDTLKAASILSAPVVSIQGDTSIDDNIYLTTYDPENSTSNVFKTGVAKLDTSIEQKYDIHINRDYLSKLMSLPYDVTVYESGIIHFSHHVDKKVLDYWIVGEESSVFVRDQ